MKISSVSAMPFRHVFGAAEASKYLRGQSLTCLFVCLRTDEGVSGYGEVCDSFCCNYPRSVSAVIEEALAPQLVGEDPTAVENLAEKLRRATRRRLGDQGVVIQAISGVEIAWWDLLGKIRDAPVSRLLGGSPRPVPVYASGSFLDEGPPDWHVRFFEPCLSRGVGMVKVRMGRDYRRDLEILRGLCKLLGAGTQVAVDGDQHYTLPEAMEVSAALENLGVVLFEEPLAQSEREAIAMLVQKTRVPVAYGGHLYTRYDFEDCLVHRRAAVVQPDASISGGIAEVMKIADLAQASGAMVMLHAAAGPLSLAANLHLAAATKNVALLEYAFPLDPMWRAMLPEPAFSPAALRDGSLTAPTGPGLGLQIDERVWQGHAPGARAVARDAGV